MRSARCSRWSRSCCRSWWSCSSWVSCGSWSGYAAAGGAARPNAPPPGPPPPALVDHSDDAGKHRAVANGVALTEVADALHAPKGLYFERAVGDLLLIVMGMAETGRVI